MGRPSCYRTRGFTRVWQMGRQDPEVGTASKSACRSLMCCRRRNAAFWNSSRSSREAASDQALLGAC